MARFLVVLLTPFVGITILDLEELQNHVISEKLHHSSLKSITARHVAEQKTFNNRFPPAPRRVTTMEEECLWLETNKIMWEEISYPFFPRTVGMTVSLGVCLGQLLPLWVLPAPQLQIWGCSSTLYFLPLSWLWNSISTSFSPYPGLERGKRRAVSRKVRARSPAEQEEGVEERSWRLYLQSGLELWEDWKMSLHVGLIFISKIQYFWQHLFLVWSSI